MRAFWKKSLALGGLLLFGTAVHAEAATYNLSFNLNLLGESEWSFSGRFDPATPKSGSGVLQFFPIEAEDPPFTESLSNLQVNLSSGVGLEDFPIVQVSIDDMPYLSAYSPFPIAFYDVPEGYIFDQIDSSLLIYSASLTTVPLPASAPMFGTALLALGGLGYAANRRKAAAAAESL